MGTIRYKLQLSSFWQTGSRPSAIADSSTQKDEYGLPMINKSTLRGLLHDAARHILELGYTSEETVVTCFGKENQAYGDSKVCSISDAIYPYRGHIKKHWTPNCYKVLQSTAIDENGVALEKALRTIEYAIPICLEGEIIYREESHKTLLVNCLKWTKELGGSRSRSFGRCHFEITQEL